MAPKNAQTTSRGRVYTRAGRNYWSVTTIIKGGLPAPALQHWGMRAVAEYAVANHAQIAAMLGAVRLQRTGGRIERLLDERLRAAFGTEANEPVYVVNDPDAVASVVDWLKGAPYRESVRKRDIGSAVHEHIEARIVGKPIPEPEPEVAPFMAQFGRFEADWSPRWSMSEATVYSDTESYAGTLDFVAELGNRPVVIIGDTKTGKAIYPEVALQLAAYARADYVGLPDGTTAPLPRFDAAIALHLTPDDYEVIPVRIDDDVYRAFLYCREVFRWVEETAKTVFGVPVAGVDSLAFGLPVAEPAPEEEVLA